MRSPIRSSGPGDATWINRFLTARWGATTIVVHGEVINAAKLPALIAATADRQGLATYRWLGRDAELVTLDADPTGIGTGSALIAALVARLQADSCDRLWLTTTNDKVSALRFYLQRDFRIIDVRLGAVKEARRLKPSVNTVSRYATNSIFVGFSILEWRRVRSSRRPGEADIANHPITPARPLYEGQFRHGDAQAQQIGPLRQKAPNCGWRCGATPRRTSAARKKHPMVGWIAELLRKR